MTCTTNPPVTYSVGGTVSGLSGTVVLQDNGGDNLTVTANGSFTFPTQLASGAAYAVTVLTQPSGQTCTVSSGTGTVGSANVTTVAVICTTSGGSGTVTASDDFNRADGPLGSNWTAMSDGAMTISSQVVAGGSSGQSGDTRTAETYTSDQYRRCRSPRHSSLAASGLVQRCGPKTTATACTWASTSGTAGHPNCGSIQPDLWKLDPARLVVSDQRAWPPGATLGLTATGSTISFLP